MESFVSLNLTNNNKRKKWNVLRYNGTDNKREYEQG